MDGSLNNDASFLKSSCCLHPTLEVGFCTRSVTVIVRQPCHFHLHSASDSAFCEVITTRLPCKVHNIGFYDIKMVLKIMQNFVIWNLFLQSLSECLITNQQDTGTHNRRWILLACDCVDRDHWHLVYNKLRLTYKQLVFHIYRFNIMKIVTFNNLPCLVQPKS